MSFRTCPACQGQAGVINSRQRPDHVIRRYSCPCGHRYSTAEFIVGEGYNPGKPIVKHFKDNMFKAGHAAARAEILAQLQPSEQEG